MDQIETDYRNKVDDFWKKHRELTGQVHESNNIVVEKYREHKITDVQMRDHQNKINEIGFLSAQEGKVCNGVLAERSFERTGSTEALEAWGATLVLLENLIREASKGKRK